MVSYSISGSYTDLYELTMGEAYFLEGRKDDPANFDYFFRKIPNGGGYVLFAGLHDLLEVLETLHFTDADISFLRKLDFQPSYIDFLRDFRFRGSIYSVKEGEVIFPHCPLLHVEGTLFETQLVETLLMNLLNFESLVPTKASRMRQVAGKRQLSDFGLRRAQGPGGVLAARAAVVGGFAGIRLDSGDLAWLSKTARTLLDEAGLSYMKIAVSNQLDEWMIRSLLEQGAPIDIFGVGTRLVTGAPGCGPGWCLQIIHGGAPAPAEIIR